MMLGLANTGFMNQELFNAFGEDVVTQFTRLTESGVGANDAMLLMQPTLQTLWELQQQFGLQTDETTQALLDQAEQQGLVGAHMKDVNEQILDVLIAIGEALGAMLPGELRRLDRATEEVAGNIVDEFGLAQFDFETGWKAATRTVRDDFSKLADDATEQIRRIPTSHRIRIERETVDVGGGSSGGGSSTTPPPPVEESQPTPPPPIDTPAGGNGGEGGGQQAPLNINIDGQVAARAVVRHVGNELSIYGVR
jgi:hypothetical protein